MRRPARIVAFAILLVPFTSWQPSFTAELLHAEIRPAVAIAPASVRVSASVEPDAENRALDFVADSPSFYRRSTVDLDGASASRLHTVEFRSLPEGNYEIRVTLTGVEGSVRAVVRYGFVVTR